MDIVSIFKTYGLSGLLVVGVAYIILRSRIKIMLSFGGDEKDKQKRAD